MRRKGISKSTSISRGQLLAEQLEDEAKRLEREAGVGAALRPDDDDDYEEDRGWD